MFIALKPGIGFCIAGGRAIFLDTCANRYACLSPGLDRAFQAQLVLQSQRPARALEERLVATGLFEWGSAPCPILPFTPRHAPQCDVDSDRHACGIVHLPVALANFAIASLTLRVGRFRAVLEACSSDDELRPAKQLDGILAAHRLLALGMHAHQTCLPRSLALKRHLGRLGTGSRLVFGVQARPFKAHCWLQRADRVLNDTIETVRDFTPIFEIS